ncbi:glycosyltransferase [Streptomyces pathocidini]|uniref:Glycosyltransferase n=1 Tax=Streptomyces pathocidini TaxID=1650571 RepID=A0ABW7ULE2_9ACTN|nr:glycosyltransferase family 2 protein [Streptomyces pathocidini]
MLRTTLEVSIALSFFLGVLFLCYVLVLIRNFRGVRPEAPGDPSEFSWHFVVPCRDEEAVIDGTLEYLTRHFPRAHVWVVDDHSTDNTASIISSWAGSSGQVHLVARRLPDARTGKGDALNYAYSRIREWMGPHADLSRAILCIVDADGRPAPNMLEVCAGPGLFGDPQIGAVQAEVRMFNRDVREPFPGEGPVANAFARMLARMQDLEFRGPISAMQVTRRLTGTVNVGGNGQLNRFSALEVLAASTGKPWGNALLEDFELGLRMLLSGWKTAYTVDTWVDQEALWKLRPLLTQRTRWAQGSMQCVRYLPLVWRSPHFKTAGFVEVLYFMCQPWLQVLGSLVYAVPISVFAYHAAVYPEFMTDFLQNGGAFLIVLYGIVGIGEFAIWGPVYRKRSEPQTTRRAALGYGLSLALYTLTTYVVAWRAFARLISGKGSWAKTKRNASAPQTANALESA